MDSFTEGMLERAKARQKKLEGYFHNSDDTAKTPLQEPNIILKKYESASKSQPNLTECSKMKCKEVVSDTNLYKKSTFKENLSQPDLTRKGCTRVSSDLQGSPQSPTKTLNIQQENFNMEIKLTSAENIRVEVEIEEHDSDGDTNNDIIISDNQKSVYDKTLESDEKPAIRKDVKNRLQRLGQLYSGEDDVQLSSPIHRTENKFYQDQLIENEEIKKPNTNSGGLGRLKALANTRNQWEDELTFQSEKATGKEIPKKSWKQPAPKPPSTSICYLKKSKGLAPQPPTNKTSESISTKLITKITSRESSPEKTKLSSPQKSPIKDHSEFDDTRNVPLDSNVLATLESQGFTRSNSNTRLVYNYKKQGEKKNDEKLEIVEENKREEYETLAVSKISKIAAKFEDFSEPQLEDKKFPRSPSKTNLRCGKVLNKASKFEQSPSKTKDPALMSVSERKALFEKNKGSALIPKAAFGMAAPIKHSEKEIKETIPVKQLAAKPRSPQKVNLPTKPVSPLKTTSDKSSILSPTKAFIAESGGIASKMKALLEKKSTISQTQIANKIHEQRQKDLDILLNRFNKNKKVEDYEEMSSDYDDDDDEEEEENISETTKMIQEHAAKIVHVTERSSLPPPPPPPPIGESSQTKTGAPKRRSKGDSPKVREVLDEVKRIRVSQPKAGRIYPCLSDIEASTEPEQEASNEPSSESSFEENDSVCTDSEEPNTSFGREILEVVCKNQTPQKRPILDDSTASDLSDILDGMDDYLDEALAYGSDNTEGPTPPKHGRSTPPRNNAAPSNSFHYSKSSGLHYDSPVERKISPMKQPSPGSKSPAKKSSSNICSPKKSSELPTHVEDEGNILPLTHTVSFYRKQQAQGNRTPIRQITRQPTTIEEESPIKENQDESVEVSEKIQELMNTVSKQQTVISQASQALNLCCSTIEFSGSSEQVEAERLLLVATQRRQAALHEVQRLRVEGTLHSGGGSSFDKGTVTISDISLPLKKEYVRALAAAGGQGHHVVCLVRYAENVIPTRLVSTVASPKDAPDMDLRVPGALKLENIYSDFTITLEVYTLQAQEELLPHEVKYHISTKKGGSKQTPKKKDSKLVMPSIQSPAGPQAVRSPSFSLVGYVVFSLQAINRTHWTLNNTPKMSPLEGSVQMRVNCELAVSVEQRGFLTMFEDISGFGAWHRRWCLLKGHSLSYWKYPEDERKKAPIDSINLKICTTKKVGQVSRDICARPHTFLLETVRPARSIDKDSLVTVCQGDKTMIRHLLSADTKEERIEWCGKFNKVLETSRLWGNK